MENKLEQLLNSLIEKGFRPFWKYDKLMWSWRFWSRQFVKFWIFPEEEFTLRELVSINSGLWQFVCENWMIAGYDTSEYYTNYRRFNKEDFTECRYLREYQYRIIESSLKDESELEDFLLSNIVIKDE